MRQKFTVIHPYDIIWCYIVQFVYLSLWPFRSVQVSPLVRWNVTKVSFTLWWEFFLLSHYHYQLQIPAIPFKCSYPCFASIVGCQRPLVCSKCPIFSLILHLLHCIVSHQARLNNIVPSVPYSTLHCEPSSLKPGSISDMAWFQLWVADESLHKKNN